MVPPRALQLVRAVYLWTIAVVIVGTLVTAAGPHGGDRDAKRLSIPITDLARLHGVLVDALVVLTLVTAVVLVRLHAPRVVLTAVSVAVIVFASVQQLELTTRAPVGDLVDVNSGGRIGIHIPVTPGSYVTGDERSDHADRARTSRSGSPTWPESG